MAAILDGLRWLELDWEGEPVSRFARGARHKAVAEELLARGNAYRCYLTPAELDALRKTAEVEKPLTIRSPRGATATPRKLRRHPVRHPPQGAARKARPSSTTACRAASFPNKDLDDLIVLRSDGTPTYNLAVVVDDHDMGITHVIRVDHPDQRRPPGADLRRDGLGAPRVRARAADPRARRRQALQAPWRARRGGLPRDGLLPAALRSYLVRLGWSHGDDEIISTAQMIAWFGLDAIGRSPARFDFAKLEDLNGHYIRQAGDDELVGRIADLLTHVEDGAAVRTKLDANGARAGRG